MLVLLLTAISIMCYYVQIVACNAPDVINFVIEVIFKLAEKGEKANQNAQNPLVVMKNASEK